jgi:hypothetical protein
VTADVRAWEGSVYLWLLVGSHQLMPISTGRLNAPAIVNGGNEAVVCQEVAPLGWAVHFRDLRPCGTWVPLIDPVDDC